MSVQAATLFLLMASLVKGLHTAHSSNIHSRQYLESLVERQSKLKADLDNLKATSEMLRSKLSMRESQNDNTRVQLFQESLAEERDILHRVETYLSFPFSISVCQCLNVSARLKAEARKTIARMEQQLRKLHGALAECQHCPMVQDLQLQADKQGTFVKEIKEILDADCCQRQEVEIVQPLVQKPKGLVDLNASIYVSNLDHTDWIFGNTTDKEMKLKMFGLISKHNTTKCKPSQPIAMTEKKCTRCPLDSPIWNVGEAKCVSCPLNQLYDGKAHRCTNKPVVPLVRKFNSQQNVENFIGTAPARQPELPDCQPGQPYSAVDRCVSCSLPNVFNYDTLKCQSCPAGQAFDLNIHSCHRIEKGLVSDIEKRSNWVTIRPLIEIFNQFAANISHKNFTKCPAEASYYDSITCIPCNPPKYFDLDKERCLSVPSDKMFDGNMHQLLMKDSRAYNTIPGSKNMLIPRAELTPTARNDLCTTDRPYYDGIACIYCQQPFPLFNVQSLKCERCRTNNVYDPNTHKCQKSTVKLYTDLSAGKIVTNGNIADKAATQNKWKQESVFPTKMCPKDAPYFNGKECIHCGQDTPLFDLQTLACMKCEADATYSAAARKCLRDIWYTNPQAANIVVSPLYDIQKFNADVEKTKQKNPFALVRMCSNPEKPFAVDGVCSSCPSSRPLYSLASKKCIQCDANRDYDPSTKTCKWYDRITSPKAPNLFLQGGRIEEYEQEYYDKKAKKPDLRDCPLSAPYFNGHTCLSCPSNKPLFDIVAKECIKCLGDTHFDEKTRSCIAGGLVQASLERAIMNT